MFLCAIGASAGGLDALSNLLQNNVSPDSELAIIIAQHLSPNHKSRLPELLSRMTDWEVRTPKDKERIKKGVVYITPPDCDITVTKKTIRLAKAASVIGPKPNINLLFESVAHNFKEKGIGIILSGSGFDGAKGIIAIKDAGGFTLAQDPEQAATDGMPNAAIESNYVDEVFNVKDTSKVLLNILGGVFQPNKKEQETMLSDFNKVLFYLEEYSNIDFSAYKDNTLKRRVKTRMDHLKLDNLQEYMKLLNKDDLEIKELFQYVLIGVTQFFRDPEAFNRLKDVLKEKAEKFDKKRFRVWVPGCATGEEPYSIAIILQDIQEEMGLDLNFQIFATDVDEKALDHARKGVYSKAQIELLNPLHIEKYFEQTSEGFQVTKKLRSSILFSRHDLTNNPPFLNLDLISCRNILIYFSSELQKKIIPIFHYGLSNDGLLFLGHSESLGSKEKLFRSIDYSYKIWKRNAEVSDKGLRFSTMGVKTGQAKAKLKKNPSFQSWIKQGLLYRYHHPFVVIDDKQQMVYLSGNLNQFLSYKEGEVTNNLFKQVAEDIEIDVRRIISKGINKNDLTLSDMRLIQRNEKSLLVRIVIDPLEQIAENYYVVIFEHFEVPPSLPFSESDSQDDYENERYSELEDELKRTKEHLQSYIEELETSNEEMQSLNEELQSTNEELQSTNEELETSNEELQSINEEVQIAYQELRQANQELEEKDKSLEKLYKNLSILIDNDAQSYLLLDVNFKLLNFNRSAEQLLESWGAKQLKEGVHLAEIFPKRMSHVFLNYLGFLNDEDSMSTDLKIEPNDAIGERHLKVNLASVVNAELEKVYSIGILDMTDVVAKDRQIQAQKKKLGRAEAEYQELFNKVNVGFAKFKELKTGKKSQDIIVFANPRFYEILEISDIKNDLNSLQDLKVRQGLDLGDKLQKFKEDRGIKNSDHSFYEISLDKWLALQVFHLHGEEYGLFLKDESKEKRLEIKLDRQLEILSRMSQMAQIGGFEYDVIKEELHWSDELFKIHELPQSKMPSVKKALDFYTEDSRRKIEVLFKRCLELGESYDVDLEITTYKNKLKKVRTFGRAEQENGKTIKVAGALMDVSESYEQKSKLEQLNEELQRSNKELENFAYVASHDLQEPIRMIRSFTDILSRNLADELSEKNTQYFKHINNGAHRIQQMVEDLLQYSRVNTKTYHFEEINANDALKTVLHFMNERIEAEGAKVSHDLLPSISFNRTLFERILSNLIDNAIKYNDQEMPEVKISYEKKKDAHLFTVIDNGPGIDEKYHDQIFTIFKRGDTKKQGSGMGLAIVQRILARFGGRVGVKSELGEGARFWFTIPV